MGKLFKTVSLEWSYNTGLCSGLLFSFDLFILTGTNYVACKNIRFSSLFAAGDVSRGGTSVTQRQKFHTDDVKSVQFRSEALIGRRSSYIVLAIVHK